MLRFFVLALLLINGVYFAWTQGFLRTFGLAPTQQSEPQRLAQQIRPEALRLLTTKELRQSEAAPVAAAKPVACLQAGLFDDAQSALLRSALEPALPLGSWSLEAALEPARWLVYMGPYASADAQARKRAELAALNLNLRFEPIGNPALELGLSLGAFDTQAAAALGLKALSQRGVRTARVVQERAEVQGMMLRLPAVDDRLRARLDELQPALAGKHLVPCA
jgi:hypothetical protein